MPPLRDPIPYERVAELFADVEPSLQTAILHDAWRDYAARAAHARVARYAYWRRRSRTGKSRTRLRRALRAGKVSIAGSFNVTNPKSSKFGPRVPPSNPVHLRAPRASKPITATVRRPVSSTFMPQAMLDIF